MSNFTSCSGGGEDGFKRVDFREALPLEGGVNDVSLLSGVVWRAVKGLLNGSVKERNATKKPTVCHFAHLQDPRRPPHHCIYSWCVRRDIRPTLPPRGARGLFEDKPESNHNSTLFCESLRSNRAQTCDRIPSPSL